MNANSRSLARIPSSTLPRRCRATDATTRPRARRRPRKQPPAHPLTHQPLSHSATQPLSRKVAAPSRRAVPPRAPPAPPMRFDPVRPSPVCMVVTPYTLLCVGCHNHTTARPTPARRGGAHVLAVAAETVVPRENPLSPARPAPASALLRPARPAPASPQPYEQMALVGYPRAGVPAK